MREFQQPVLACSFGYHQIFQIFHVRQAHFARRQAKTFSIQIKNIFACAVLAFQFRHANLATGENGKKATKLRILALDKQCWPISPGLNKTQNGCSTWQTLPRSTWQSLLYSTEQHPLFFHENNFVIKREAI